MAQMIIYGLFYSIYVSNYLIFIGAKRNFMMDRYFFNQMKKINNLINENGITQEAHYDRN